MRRRDFLHKIGKMAIALIGSGALFSFQDCNRSKSRKPNIILIVADDLGYGDLGCYGQQQIQTPYIDQMAAEGMRFTDYYAGSTVCAPSRCSLMTGLHTGHCYIRGNEEVLPMGQLPLPLESVTVAKLLKKCGYTTALVGKWGLGGPGTTGIPNKQGFDHFFGYLCQRHAHNYYPEFLFRNEERVTLDNKIENPRPDGAGVATKKSQYSHDLIMDEALSFIKKNRGKPFFLCLTPTIPHANNEAGREGMEIPSDEPYSAKNWPQQEKNFAAMITRLDRDVGRIMNKLKELNIDENTVVFFTSDNGPHREGGHDPDFFDSNGALRGIKRDLYEGGIRVPMIARWPNKIKDGTLTSHVSTFWDFLPTAAELSGIKSPSGTDGISIVPTLVGKEQKNHDYLYWEFKGNQAVRMGDFKAVRHGLDKPIELYNLKTDIGETKNVAEKYPKIVNKIKEYMESGRTESRYFPLKKGKRKTERGKND